MDLSQQADAIAWVRSQGLRPRQAANVLHALGHDPDAMIVDCENPKCANTVAFGQTYSFGSQVRTTGGAGVPALQCAEEQHFGCSWECAREALLHCLEQHLRPAHQDILNQLTLDRAKAAGGEHTHP